jgi:hypothetical protein
MSDDDFSTACLARQVEPIALAVFKRGRWCVMAKLTNLGNETVLGIAIKEQQGTSEMISLPLAVIDYAGQHAARWLYWRRDRFPSEMRRIPLDKLKRDGYLQRDGEVYFPLAAMEEVPWRQWEYAEKVIRLAPKVKEDKPDLYVPIQLALALEGAVNEL